MAKIQLKKSAILDGANALEPTNTQMLFGELAVNYNADDPSIFFKDSDESIVRIAGKNAIGNRAIDIEGYPTLTDGLGVVLDDRYLKLNSAGTQVIGSTGLTQFSGGIKVTDSTTHLLELSESGSTRVVVTNDGKLGVGTSTPTFALQVVGTVAATTATISSNLTAAQLISTVAAGTAPLSVTSTTRVNNLNSDTVDGLHAASFLRSDIDIVASNKITFSDEITVNSDIKAITDSKVIFGSNDLDMFASSDGSFYIDNKTDNNIKIQENGVNSIVIDTANRVLKPSINNTGSIGTSTRKWNAGYFQNLNSTGTITANSLNATTITGAINSSNLTGTINTARLPSTYTLAEEITIEATGSLGNLNLNADSNIEITTSGSNSFVRLSGNNGQQSYRFTKAGQSAIEGFLDFESLTSDRTFTLPDLSGTIALTTSTVDNADKVDNLHASSFLRSDTADTMTGRLTFANTGTASTFNYFLRASNDGGNKAVQFVNGSTRTADGGPNTYTIRNDGGSLRLGKSGFSTLIEGAGDLTYNSNVVWHAGNDGASSTLDADLLDGQHGSYYTGYTDTAIANLIDSSPGTLDTLNELAAALGDDANFSTTITNSLATKLPLAGGAMTGNITFSGSQTVDGRDLSADGSKLDGIETGATADQTAAEILALLTTVDGAGSGLNADQLDGHTSSYFQYASTAVNTSTTFGGDVVGTYNSLAVVNDSHTHDTRYFTETEADARFLGITAKAADSDKLDNLGSGSFLRSNANDTYTGVITGHQLHLGGSQIMSSVAKLQVNGLLRTGTIYLHEGGSSPTSTAKTLSNSSGVLQWDGDTVWTSSNNGAGSSLNADQVDGYEAVDLLKSSEDDSFSGNLTGSGTIYTTGTYMGIKGNGGGVCLTTNDGGGNANVTFNHKSLVPDQSGSAGRIECAVDGGTAAMYFELEDNVTANTSTGLSNILTLTTSNFTAFGNKVWHAGNHGASSTLDADLLDGQHGSYYTGYTDTAIANLIDSSPGTLNTLNELAAALGDDANFSTTITDSIALKLPKTGGTMSGNIVFTGSQTVDGRDLSVDGTKLDGIEAGATGDQSAAEILNLLKTVDTNSSGLNADTLDGQQGSFYQNASNLTSGTILDARITDIGDTQARIITLDNLEKSNLNGDGQIAFDSSQGLLVYRVQQGAGSGACTTVLDGWNIAEGANISITNLGAGNTDATEFTFSVNRTNLDADQLDGQEGSFYQNASNLTTGTISDARIPDTITPLTLVQTEEVRGNGTQLVLNAGESAGKIASQTGELVYVNAEGGLRISTPSVSNWGSGYVEQRTNITGGGIFFHRNTTPMGEITTQDTTWLRINQNTNKNIYTPRYIRADAGFFVDGTAKGINGSGNFIGGTIAGASDYSTLLRSNASDEYRGGTLSINSDSSNGHYVGWGLEYKSSAWRHTNANSWGHAQRNSGGILDIYVAQEAGTADSVATYRALRVGGSSQLLQYDGHNIWHAGNDGAGSGLDADTVDGIQAASFIRSDADDTTLGSLTIDVDNKSAGALRINANQTNPQNDYYFAQEIVSTLSGSTATTADREQGGIYMDINSTATGGDTQHEHRAYGILIDLDSSGDADIVYGIYSDATATPSTGTTSEVVGVYGRAEDNGGAGSVSNVHGVRGEAYSDNSTSDINNMYGGFFKSGCSPDTGDINAAHGVYAEIQIDDGAGDHLGNSYVVRAVYDDNDGVAQTNTTYLFHGDYTGTRPTTAYGVYIADAVNNYFAGNVGIGVTNPTFPLQVQFATDSGLFVQSTGSHASVYIDAATGSSSYIRFRNNGSNKYWIQESSGGLLFRPSGGGTTTRFNSAGTIDQLGNNYITFGPNSTWSKYLRIGGNGYQGSSTIANIATTNGNLHIDAASGYGTYLNYYAGNFVAFCSGANTITAYMTSSGDLYKGGNASGSKYWHAANDGTGSGLDADTVDGIQGGSFLRSDANDTASGELTFNGRVNIRGHLDLSDGENLDFGSSDDVRINYNSNNWLYCDFRTGNGIAFRDNGVDTTILEDSGIFRPQVNNTGSLGTSSRIWGNVYATTFTGALTGTASGNLPLTGGTLTGDLTVPSKILHAGDSDTYIQFDANDKFRVVCAGAEVQEWGNNYTLINDNDTLRLGNGSDFRMWFSGADTVFRNYAHADGDIIFQGENSAGTNQNILIMKTDGTRTYNILYENGAERFRTNSTGVKVTGIMESTSSVTLGGELNLIGTADANKYIDCRVGTNSLYIRKTTGGDAGHETMARFIGDGGVELYHDNVKKFETTSTGVTITDGSLNVENAIGNNITLSTMVGNGNDSTLIIQKSRGGSGGPSQITAGDALGQILWRGYDLDSYNAAASITCISSSNTGDFDSTLLVDVGGTNSSFTSAGFTVGGTLSVSGGSTFTGRVNIRGHLDLSDGENLDFGSSDDVRINYNSNNWLYCDFRTGNGIVFRDNGVDTTILEDSGIFRPQVTNTGTIGTSSRYWAESFITQGTFQSSNNQLLLHNPDDETVIHRNDGSNYYILLSNAGAAPSGSWNSLRPFYINTNTGKLHSNNGQDFAGGMSTGTITLDAGAVLSNNTDDSYDKLRVWNSGTYAIGMKSGCTHGDLNDYAMTFTMNSDDDRGFLWRDTDHGASGGAMSLSTRGSLEVSRGINIGGGETNTGWSDHPLHVDNSWQTGQNNGYTAAYIDADWSGTAAFNNNKSQYGLRVDVDNSKSNTTSVSGNRNTVYGIGTTVDNTGYTHDTRAGYFFAKSTASGDGIGTQSVFGVYGYAQAYVTAGASNAYGGHFLAYRGGNTAGGTLYGVYARAQSTTNGSGKSGNAVGGYFEVECDEDTIADAKGVFSHIDRDAGTITTGYLFYGSYAGTVGTKWGTYITGETKNYFSGNLGIGSTNPVAKLDVNGNINCTGSFTASGNITAYSDIKLKENIELIANPLDKVNQINGVTFDRIDAPKLGRQMGVIAQDVEKVCPELVSTGKEGTKSVAYGNMVGLLIEAIKDQQKQIDELRAQLENK